MFPFMRIINMFKRKCPSCSKIIPYNTLKKSAKSGSFDCPHCSVSLAPKFSVTIVTSLVFGAGLGAILAKSTDLSIELIIVGCMVFTVFFQKYVDVFFSLEVVEE